MAASRRIGQAASSPPVYAGRVVRTVSGSAPLGVGDTAFVSVPGLFAEQPHQLTGFGRVQGRGGRFPVGLFAQLARRVEDMGVPDRGLRIGESRVGLVAQQGVQQEAGEQGAGGAGGFRLVFAAAEGGQYAAALGETVVSRAVQGAQKHRPGPGRGQGDGDGIHRVQLAHTGQDQRGSIDIGGQCFGGGGRGRGEQRSHRGHAAPGRREHGRTRAHPVTGQGEAFGVHGESTVTEADPGADIERGEQVGGQVQMRGQRAALGIRGGGDDPPGREVLQQRAVVAGAVEPAVTERDRG